MSLSPAPSSPQGLQSPEPEPAPPPVPPLRVAVDLSYAKGRPHPRELKSLAQQLSHCVGVRRKAGEAACDLSFCEFVDSPVGDLMGRIWNLDAWGVTLTEGSVEDTFRGVPVVALTPDGDEVLDELDPNCCYVIGGIVDSPIRPMQSRMRAKAAGWRAARLPLRECLPLSSSRVLSLNSVLAALLHRHAGLSWREALAAAVPTRMQEQRPKRRGMRPTTPGFEAARAAEGPRRGAAEDPAA